MKEGKRRVHRRRAAPAHQAVQRLLETLNGMGNVLILTHDNPDPDAIASAHALRHLLREKLGLQPTVGFGGTIGRAENSAMVGCLGIDLTHISQIDPDAFPAIALLDTQPGTGNSSLPPSRHPDLVIDHHPLRAETRKATFYDVRPACGATSTMLAEYLWEAGVAITPSVATALLFGLKAETQDLVRMAGRVDIDTYLRLYALADVPLLAEIQRPKLWPSYFRDLYVGLQTSTIHGRAIFCTLSSAASPDMAAELADFLLRAHGVEWSICFAYFGDNLFVSVRTGESGANAGELVRKVVGSRGSAGGHDVMAGARLPAPPEPEERGKIELLLRARFLKALGLEGVEGRPLLGEPA